MCNSLEYDVPSGDWRSLGYFKIVFDPDMRLYNSSERTSQQKPAKGLYFCCFLQDHARVPSLTI